MKKEYDVIIIGSGPGGMECANALKNSKLSVLLIEKNKKIGEKVCAGGLTNLSRNFDILNNKIKFFHQQKILIKDKLYLIDLLNPLGTIYREELSQYQFEKINRANNIDVIIGVTVEKIEDGFVVTSEGIFNFKFLVGADGSNSIVRKYLNIKTRVYLGICYDLPTITDSFIWYFNIQKLKSGYIWAFPHRKSTNIGAYFNPEILSVEKVKEELHNFMKKQNYSFENNKIKAAPINYFYKGCVFSNIFLVGDAAGLASRATGEGISFALVSGSEVAKKILNPKYKMREMNKVLKIKRRQERMFKVFEFLPVFQNIMLKFFVNLMRNKRFQKYFGN